MSFEIVWARRAGPRWPEFHVGNKIFRTLVFKLRLLKSGPMGNIQYIFIRIYGRFSITVSGLRDLAAIDI